MPQLSGARGSAPVNWQSPEAGAQGFVAPGFEPVAEEFARNFTLRGDVGAAFAATIDAAARRNQPRSKSLSRGQSGRGART